jgi:hypothetical protein
MPSPSCVRMIFPLTITRNSRQNAFAQKSLQKCVFPILLALWIMDQRTPSCSPGNLLIRFCSQLSRSLAASFYSTQKKSANLSTTLPHHITSYPTATRALLFSKEATTTHIILLLHVYPPPVFANPQFLVLGHRLHFPIMSLVAQRCRGCEEETAQQHCADEG